MNPDDWLHLFTSNIRELYVQDALSILAAPDGLRYRFRYSEEYVAEGIREDWRKNNLTGRSVATYFSLQHPLNFHAAAYLPLRSATVVRSEVEGRIHVIDFRIGGYLPLVDAETQNRARPVRELTEALKDLLGSAHPDSTDEDYARSPGRRSASTGDTPLNLTDSKGALLT